MTMKEKKEKNYRKQFWRIVFWACIAYGAVELLGSLAAWLLYLSLSDPLLTAGEAASVGIIGGADGQTAIFVSTSGWTGYLLPAALLAVGILGLVRMRRGKQK